MKKKRSIIIIIVAIAILVLAIVRTVMVHESIIEYNNVARAYNSLLVEYKLIDSDVKSISTLETVSIYEKHWLSAFKNIFNLKQINKEVEAIKYVKDIVEDEIKISDQITNPTTKWVEDRVKAIDCVTGTQPVSLSDNPDGLLGNVDGYKGCIYFTVEYIDSDLVSGDSIVDKGNAAGGTIEIYESKTSAINRNNYLSEFDNTVLNSGSHMVLGTMVVRTSHLLDAEKQKELTNQLCEELCFIDNE